MTRKEAIAWAIKNKASVKTPMLALMTRPERMRFFGVQPMPSYKQTLRALYNATAPEVRQSVLDAFKSDNTIGAIREDMGVSLELVTAVIYYNRKRIVHWALNKADGER